MSGNGHRIIEKAHGGPAVADLRRGRNGIMEPAIMRNMGRMNVFRRMSITLVVALLQAAARGSRLRLSASSSQADFVVASNCSPTLREKVEM